MPPNSVSASTQTCPLAGAVAQSCSPMERVFVLRTSSTRCSSWRFMRRNLPD